MQTVGLQNARPVDVNVPMPLPAVGRQMLRAATSLAVTKATAAKAEWYNEHRLYRQLCHRRSSEFWREKLETESDLRRIQKTVDVLLGRSRVPASSTIDGKVLNQFSNFTSTKLLTCN